MSSVQFRGKKHIITFYLHSGSFGCGGQLSIKKKTLLFIENLLGWKCNFVAGSKWFSNESLNNYPVTQGHIIDL